MSQAEFLISWTTTYLKLFFTYLCKTNLKNYYK